MHNQMWTPIEFLQEMTHSGPFLHERCVALGFDLHRREQGTIVKHHDQPIASIVDNKFAFEPGVDLDALADSMKYATEAQQEAFYRADRPRIAVHEAGHIVAAFLLQIEIRCARLDNDDRGEVIHEGDPEGERGQQYYAAGAAAETLDYGMFDGQGACADRARVKRLEQKKSRAPAQCDVFEVYVEKTAQILPSALIHAVAERLDKQGRLTGKELEAILRSGSEGTHQSADS